MIMPILGNLSEFPLPEVLLLIGVRTGRLRLLDVPEFEIMDIDFSNGETHALHLGDKTFTEIGDIIDKFSAIVQAQAGMFEFKSQPVTPVARPKPLTVNELVLSLICYVDEQLARQRAAVSPHCWYMLEITQPDIWIEPDLHTFFLAAQSYLATGIHPDDLAERMNLDISFVRKNLTNLRLLGQVKMIDGAETVPLVDVNMQKEISRKSSEFLRASRTAGEMKKISSNPPPTQMS